MNRRQRMQASNTMVKNWLLENKYDQIWFKAHNKFKDKVYCQNGTYKSTDLWNIFDGICIREDGVITFLQIKTNAWAKKEPFDRFTRLTNGVALILSFNVTNKLKKCKQKYKVFVREY